MLGESVFKNVTESLNHLQQCSLQTPSTSVSLFPGTVLSLSIFPSGILKASHPPNEAISMPLQSGLYLINVKAKQKTCRRYASSSCIHPLMITILYWNMMTLHSCFGPNITVFCQFQQLDREKKGDFNHLVILCFNSSNEEHFSTGVIHCSSLMTSEKGEKSD